MDRENDGVGGVRWRHKSIWQVRAAWPLRTATAVNVKVLV